MKTFSFTELTEMTVANLRSLAADFQIPGRSKATRKADLISLILAFQTKESVVEIEPTPAPVNTDDDESNPSEDSDDRQWAGGNCPGFNTHVSLGHISHPPNTLKTPPAYSEGLSWVTWEILQKHPALSGVPVRGPPLVGLTSL